MKLFFIPQHACKRIQLSKISKSHFHESTTSRWMRPKHIAKTTGARQRYIEAKMEEQTDYSAWSNERLIERVTQLEKELKSKNQSLLPPGKENAPEKKSWKKPRTERVFDPAKYNTRLIALKLAYLGKKYHGFEHHPGQDKSMPTIEEELWKALNKARLIFPQATHPLDPGVVNWEGTEYSKCGRTDKGVSAFGQVIGIRVRSNRPLVKRKENVEREIDVEDGVDDMFNMHPREDGLELGSPALRPSRLPPPDQQPSHHIDLNDPELQEALNFDPIADEIPYCALLNHLLPPEIRILAWCPAPPIDFSARFSCRERRYKYFFTNPAFAPVPHNLEGPGPDGKVNTTKMKDGYLDIEAMREAAKMFEGTHDFRNFCKVDPGKQITNFERMIFHTEIKDENDTNLKLIYTASEDFSPGQEEKTGMTPSVWSFNLHGSAFLWHQVRCMVAVLFLVGQGLEKPSIVAELLDTKTNPRRPTYEMATDTPLVLWECIFPREDDPERKDAMQWIYVGDGPGKGDDKYAPGGLVEDLWGVWREAKIDEMLAGTLLEMVQSKGDPVKELTSKKKRGNTSQKVFDGGETPRLQGIYTPVMKKPLMELVHIQNENYAVRKGFKDSADMKAQGYRRTNKVLALENQETTVDVVEKAT
ncbi:hypothetical protein HYFRA_00012465 [Hymenoscyphus fraxineus]|uniref:Pseudouridine synthase I TruA alpha/beta domain-containing protein n=1 Tax=Hymenoscyphus fraxineus TaxID=746836 RepID=A0A9N9L1N6_9HELO|nr:hypothetical protein HYFRA_00012465 [Hymenoscyphus fraxineus]